MRAIPIILPVIAMLYFPADAFVKKRIAVMDFTSNSLGKSFGNIARSYVESSLYKMDFFEILERTKADLILKEWEFQLSGCSDSTCAVEIGRLLSLDYAVLGSIEKLDKYQVMLKIVEVGSGIIVYSGSKDIASENQVTVELENLVSKATATLAAGRKESVLGILGTNTDIQKDAKSDWETSLKKRASFIRFGMGNAEMMDRDLNHKVTNDMFYKFDWFFLRERNYAGDGIDFFASYFKKDYTASGNVAYKTSIKSLGGDLGMRAIYGAYLLFEHVNVYISGAFRYLAIEESGNQTVQKFTSKGFIGAAGLEMTLISYIGFFTEAGLGYTPVGKSKRNVEGIQYLFGITMRTGYN